MKVCSLRDQGGMLSLMLADNLGVNGDRRVSESWTKSVTFFSTGGDRQVSILSVLSRFGLAPCVPSVEKVCSAM